MEEAPFSWCLPGRWSLPRGEGHKPGLYSAPSARVLVGSSDPFPHQHSVWPPPAAAAPLCALQYPIAATMETAADGGLQKNFLIKTCLKL